MKKPVIAIPMGDPAGIGAEIIVKALGDPSLAEWSNCVVIGDAAVLSATIDRLKLDLNLKKIATPSEAFFAPKDLPVIDLANIDSRHLKYGVVSGLCGKAAYEYIEKSIELAASGQVDAIATTPINKESLRAGNVPFIGHTEIFAGLTGTADPLTMFEVRNLRVFFLSRHVSLRKACDLVTKERVIDYVKRCYQALAQLGIENARMAVAGLNPHSGEHGLFGDEEMMSIYPAIEKLQNLGYNVVGPIGADSVFHLALQGRYDSVLSLYHDQGHIATKTLDFERTISVTNGLPFLRTSVDHGTAFDIAGQGIASPISMLEAIRVAAKYAPFYNAGLR